MAGYAMTDANENSEPSATARDAAAAIMADLRERGEFCFVLQPNKRTDGGPWATPDVQASLEARIAELIDEAIRAGAAQGSQGMTDIDIEAIRARLEDAPPTGAIENGREFFRRLEDVYAFECEGGALSNCAEWQELRRCFDALVDHVAEQSSALEAANKRAGEAEAAGVTDDQIDHMVDRFLNWKLPENFNPDGGISFQKTTNENTPWPHKSEPVGTNLFDTQQAKAMVRHMVEGLHCKPHNEPAADEARALSARLEAETKRAQEAHSAGWLYLNPDTGIEFSVQHPIKSGEVEDAENVRPATAKNLVSLLLDAWSEKDRLESVEANLIRELTALRARVAELEGALRPFAAAMKWISDEMDDDYTADWTQFIPYGDYRRAAAALKGASHEQG